MGDTSDSASIIMDEIALEGLDGITVEGLFVRLKERPEFTSSLNDAYKQYIWNIICKMSEIDMFELSEARKPLIIFNRYDYVDPEVGMVLEPETLPEEMYPHAPVDDKEKGIRGSCALYEERKCVYDIASQVTLSKAIDSWGTKLVIVASQKMRNLALMGSSVDPELELTILQYCILERVGRSRHLGEVTQGRVSLQITGEDPKALFYHRKFLMKNGLIVKQIHHQKSGTQNCSGSLLHLPRFYVERWPKVLFLTKRVIEILRGCKNYIADYEEIRKKLGLTNSLKKLFQTTYFQRFVRTDLRLPYRHLYPDARESEWRSFNSMKEKMIRVIQLLDPNVDIDAISAKDDEYDIDEDEHGDATSSHEEFSVTLNRSFLSQAYQCIKGAGVNGYSQMQLVQKMGLPKLSARTVSRNLLKRGVATKFMNDVGRQRVSRFRARKWDQQCTRIQNIERDIQHMRAELLSKALGAGHEISGGSVTQSNKRHRKRSADLSIDDLREEIENTEDGKHVSDSAITSPPCKVLRTDTSENVESSNVEMLKEHNKGTGPVVPVAPSFSSSPLYCSVAKFQSKEAIRKNFRRHSNDGPVMTYRIFKRINMILEYVKIHKVVDDHSKFLKLINEEEEREGLNMKIDKKSLLRLLIRLKEDDRLKLHSYLLTDGVKIKTMMFICDRKIPLDHPAIVSAIEQAKMKLFIVNRDNINLAVAGAPTKDAYAQKAQNKKQKMTFVYDKKIGRKYGFCPKFIRMRTLHQFLFYLIYGYEGDPNLDQDAVVPFLESKDVTVDEGLRSELTQTYILDIHWKMFIPPLPDYPGWPKGWSIMCDLLLRLPLSVFVRIFNVCYVVAGLNEYLQHPVRRHFLVRQLPVPMRNGLMAFRKYIFSIHEVVQRLCYIGLVQFGPQRLKEKDQVLIFVNRRTNLLDTISSKPGYHQISEDEYPEMKYEFKCMQDVDAYWYNLWNICINTQLGGRMCVQGKDIVLEHLAFKPQMQEALQPVRPSRAPTRDVGAVPGDRRGAAGLDSAIFAHLKRNWNWANITTKSGDGPPRKVDRRKYRLMNLKAAPVVFTKSAIIVKRSINYLHNGRFNALRTERRCHVIPPGAEVLPKKGQKGKQNVVRRIEARKSRASIKPFYDDVDLKALQLMNKLRVEWSTEEDTLLLLCKVASMYLCPNPRQQTIAFSTIRDILHASIPEAQNKTSRACQRRILYIMKNLATSNNLAMHLEELKQDEDICERFGKPEDNARGSLGTSEEFEMRINEKFRLLVSELQGRSDRMVAAAGTYCSTIPDRADDFWKLFDVVEPRTVIKSKGVFQDVKNVVDIHCSVVNSIIHSSLCSTTDKTSWAYQLFRVYQQYPDSLLRAAMAKLRQDQMVSLKKSYARYKQKANYLPLSSSPYQLSVSYLQLIQTKYQYGVYHEAYEMLKELLNWKEESNNTQGMPVTGVSGGGAATMVESLCKKGVLLLVEIPEQVIILDPWISEKDETYTRIVQRYRDILQTYRTGRDSTTSALFRRSLTYTKESNEIEMEEEEEAEEEEDDEEMKAMECDTKTCKLPGQVHEISSCQDCTIKSFCLGSESDKSLVNQESNINEVSEILPACPSSTSTHSVQKTTVRNPLEGDATTRCVVTSELQEKQISDESQISEKLAIDIVTYNSQDENCLPLLDIKEGSSQKQLINSNEKLMSESEQKKNLLIKSTLIENSSHSAELMDINNASLPTNNTEETSTFEDENFSKINQKQEEKYLSKENNMVVPTHETSSSSEDINTAIKCSHFPSEDMELSSQEEPLVSVVNMKSTHLEISSEMQIATKSLLCVDLVESENNIIKNDRLNSMKNQSNVVSGSVEQVSSQETPSATNELENSLTKRNILDTENAMSVKIDRTLNRKWGRLDFEWTSDKEWDTETDISERGVEETDDTDGVEDDRIRGDYINIVGETDDAEGVTPNNQQTLVARAASRIALFMMKEEMDDTCHVKNTQHAHDFFVVNSCSVFCKLCAEEKVCSTADDNITCASSQEVLLSLTQERIDHVLDAIKKEIIVELQVPSEEEILKGVPESDWQSIMTLVHYIESKKYLGATLPQIQLFLGNDKRLGLANVLSMLLQKRVLMRTGVTVPRYVHKRNIWPWLAHTFRFLRLEREKVVPIDARVVTCSDETDENAMEVEISEEIIADTKSTSEEKVLETMMKSEPEELAMKFDNCSSSRVPPDIKNVDIEMTEEVHISNSDSVDETTVKNKETLEMSINNQIPMTEKIDCGSETTPLCTETVEKEDELSTTKRFSGHKTKLSVSHPLGTIVSTKDMRKVAQGLSFSERDEIHIAIRPWIRINGTLNRRVLDRLLGAVLGHAMYQPGQSLYAFGLRFQPALQPVHTRELIEILQSLGCIKLLVRQQRPKVTLFSKPQPIILVNADGTEDEQEIIVEPQPDAICRLGQFIGEKSYGQDFMAAQEQMFSGRGPAEETSKRKRFSHEKVTSDETSNEPSGSNKEEGKEKCETENT